MKKLKVSDINTNEKRIRPPRRAKPATPAHRLSEIMRHSFDLGKEYYFERLATSVYGDQPTVGAYVYLFNKYQIEDMLWPDLKTEVVKIAGLRNVEIKDQELFQWLYSEISSTD